MASGHKNTWQKFDRRHSGILRKKTVAVLVRNRGLKWTIKRLNGERPLRPYLDRKELEEREKCWTRDTGKPSLYLSLVSFNSAQAKCFKPGNSAFFFLSGFCPLIYKWNTLGLKLGIYSKSEVESKETFSKLMPSLMEKDFPPAFTSSPV